MRGLIIALMLLSGSAHAAYQPPAGSDLSQGNVTATGGTTARTLASRWSGCDPGGATGCHYLDVKDYGFSTAGTATSNRNSLVATIAKACALGTDVLIHIGAGLYSVDTTAGEWAVSCSGISIQGDGPSTTVLEPSGTSNNRFHFTSGFGSVSNIYLYEATPPTGGAEIVLDHVNDVWIHDVSMASSFIGINSISSGGVWIDRVNMGGTNNTSGATGIWFHRVSSADNHCTDTFVNSSDLFESGWTNPVIINTSDGIWLSNSHFGLSNGVGADILIQPLYTNEALANIFIVGDHMDGGTYGVDFEPIASYSGIRFNEQIIGGAISQQTIDGILVNDPSVNMLSIHGVTLAANANNGVNIQAGSNIDVTGNVYQGNNTSNGGYSDVIAGGTSSNVRIDGTFGSYSGHSAAYNVSIANSANHVIVGPSVMTGSLTSPTNITTSGTDISIISPLGTGTIQLGSSTEKISIPSTIISPVVLENDVSGGTYNALAMKNLFTTGGTTVQMTLGTGTLSSFSAWSVQDAFHSVITTGAGLSGGLFLQTQAGPITLAPTTQVISQGAIVVGQTKFTTSGCSISVTSGSGTAGTYTSGTTGTCTAVVTMNGATGMTAPNGWNCYAADWTTPADAQLQTASSATTATIAGTTVSGDVIHFACQAY